MFTRRISIRRIAGAGLVACACVGSSATIALGQIIHLDPQTGARSVPSPGAAPAIPPDPAFSTSGDGLVEEPAPGGGVTVDLQGRFRGATRATVGPDGKVSVGCPHPGVTGEKE